MQSELQSTDRKTERQFIGRRTELDASVAALDRAVVGVPGIVLLAGEPGIGKTRTAQEVCEAARERGLLALWGRCPEEPGAPPYWPWVQMLRRYVAQHDAHVREQIIGPAAVPIASLDQELARSLAGGKMTPAEHETTEARFRLFDSIAGFWQRAAARQPLLLAFDDLHRADVPSLRLLEFLMAEAGASRLMVLGTYRDAEVTRQNPLSSTLAELNRHARVQRFLLGGFNAAETAQFVEAAGGPAAEIAATLHDQTDGHPLFLSELVREILEARKALPASAPPARLALRVPKGVREVIGARLNHLAAPSVHLLQHAAVIGREFDFDLLRKLSPEVSEEQSVAALEEARTASLIAESADACSYQFSHALVRDSLYDELSPARRARLHQQIAAALEERYQGDATPGLSALAHHYHAAGAAGDLAKAIEYAIRAAEHAATMHAHEEAIRHFLNACELLPSVAVAETKRCRILLGLGNAQNCAGESTAALASFADAAAFARQIGDPSLLARAAIGFGNAQWRLGNEGSRAVTLIREALALATPADSRERVALLSAACRALLFSNRPDEAEATFREAVAIARRLDEPSALFQALSSIVPGRWFAERLPLRIAAAREAIELVQRAGRPEWVVGFLTGWHTGDLMELGDTAAASAIAHFHVATAQTMREPFTEAVGLAALAMIATHEGRFADAKQLALRARKCGLRFDSTNAEGIFGVQMFTIQRLQGRLGEVAPILRQFLDDGARAAWRPGLVVLLCELGLREEAREVFERLAVDDFGGITRDAIWAATIAYLAEACVSLGDVARAATLFDMLLPYAGRNIVFGAHTASFGAAARLLGMLAATLQRWEEAERQFEAALAFDARTGGRPWLALSRCEFAAMLVRRVHDGDHERARQLLACALDDARALGMHGLEQRVVGIEQQVESRAVARKRETSIAGLSDREIQVLRLVAAGKTNQEIAQLLCRSPNTVAIHVRNILGKTQAANRAEAAAFAVRNGLVPPQ
ncbi:MAG TPA: AAA family ATPase [Burkholderiaceae bacterium]|nr:AAA family ATPase [Burkholderiaceae bacterium]